MRKHHGVDESNAASEPCGSEMRAGVQDMYNEKDNSQPLLRNSEAPKKPICYQGIGQEAPTESVQRK